MQNQCTALDYVKLRESEGWVISTCTLLTGSQSAGVMLYHGYLHKLCAIMLRLDHKTV